METGNPKQVAALGVVAVGAFGFLFTRLSGKSLSPLPPATTLAVRETPVQKAGVLVLSKDPFSHPHLAPAKKESAPAEIPPKEAFHLLGDLPTATLPGPDAPVGPLRPDVTVEKPTKSPAPVLTSVALEAVAGASDAVAFLSVGGAESRPFRLNDCVEGAIRLVRVDDGTVVLAGPKGRVTLAVGERRSL